MTHEEHMLMMQMFTLKEKIELAEAELDKLKSEYNELREKGKDLLEKNRADEWIEGWG